MKQEYEVIKYKSLKHINILINDIHYRNVHSHNELEIIHIIDGKGIIKIGNKEHRVKKGDTYAINFNEAHEYIGTKDHLLCLIIQISHNFIKDYFPTFKELYFDNSKPLKTTKEFILLIYNLALTYFKQDSIYELLVMKDITELITYLTDNLSYELNTYTQNDKDRASRMLRWQNYIDEHLNEILSLSDLARLEDLTETYISHLFTEYFGITFYDYINNLRFEKALSIISDKSLSIYDIALECGFSDPKYLNKQFIKYYGCSAREFRNNNDYSLKENMYSNTLKEYIYSYIETIELLNNKINFLSLDK